MISSPELHPVPSRTLRTTQVPGSVEMPDPFGMGLPRKEEEAQATSLPGLSFPHVHKEGFESDECFQTLVRESPCTITYLIFSFKLSLYGLNFFFFFFFNI